MKNCSKNIRLTFTKGKLVKREDGFKFEVKLFTLIFELGIEHLLYFDGNNECFLLTYYNNKDEQTSRYVFKQTKGTKLDLKNVNSKTLKKVIVPETVKANGKTYKVTRVRKGFLKNCKQATNVFIGKYVNTIDKNAFKYGKKVKIVTIDGRLNKVGKGAFKNTKKNVIIKLKNNAKNFKKNKKLLVKSGLPKNATVKRVKNKK